MVRSRVPIPAGLILAQALGLAACGASAPAPRGPPPPPAVQVVEASPPHGEGAVTATGALRRRREMALSFRIPGVITRLGVDEGDTVRRGQVLATLDPAAVDARLRQAAADLDRARRDAERFSRLVERGAISRQQAEAQNTQVADAQAAYDAAAFDRRWAALAAPANGVVLVRQAQAGEVVQPGQTVVILADDDSPLVLRAPISDRDIGRVRIGGGARVRLDSLPGEVLTGTVTRIGQQAGPQNGAVEIEITLPTRLGLRSGLIARAEIDALPEAGGAAAGLSRVPAETILEATGERAFVMRFDPSTGLARRTPVRFGGFDGDDALVGGLPPGARLITAGAGYVSDGERVSVVDPTRLPGDGAASRR